MTTPTFSAKLPDVTIRQLNELAAQFGVSKSQIVIQAVRQLHQQEIKTMYAYPDPITRQRLTGTIEELDNSINFSGEPGAHLYAFTFTADDIDMTISIIDYEGWPRFSVVDWQGQQPQSLAEAKDYNWMDEDGKPAVMMDGLPIALA